MCGKTTIACTSRITVRVSVVRGFVSARTRAAITSDSCVNIWECPFVDAVEALTGEHIDRTYTPSRTYEQKPKTVTARELSLAEADNARRVFAYLCKTRGLDYDTVSALVRNGSIAQQEKTGNVHFQIL